MISNTELKRCSKCLIEFPFSNFYSGKKNNRIYYYMPCKKCRYEYQKKYIEENKEKVKETIKRYCSKPETKEKAKLRQKKYLSNPENLHKRKKSKKIYHSKPEVKIMLLEYWRKYRSKPEKKLMRKEYHKKYYQKKKLEKELSR